METLAFLFHDLAARLWFETVACLLDVTTGNIFILSAALCGGDVRAAFRKINEYVKKKKREEEREKKKCFHANKNLIWWSPASRFLLTNPLELHFNPGAAANQNAEWVEEWGEVVWGGGAGGGGGPPASVLRPLWWRLSRVVVRESLFCRISAWVR